MREWDASDEEGNVRTQRAIVAAGIAGLRFSRSGTLVTVSLDYDLPTDIYAPGRRTVTTRVWLRN